MLKNRDLKLQDNCHPDQLFLTVFNIVKRIRFKERNMKHQKTFIAIIAVILLGLSSLTSADEVKGNWKKGRVYYRMVCTECHTQQAGHKISPAEKTRAEWLDYFEKNIHGPQDAPAKYAASYFISQEYRESIKDTNRAAAKMLDIPDDQLLADVKAFLVHTAKDSDQPSRCE
jgi:hypothetical protein